ncbi:hypothetical protein M0R45_010850 [Rubus argutus]|uniref:Xylanase inhibitor C-terminal domain-containing protein n=1 Tax=Rubus argutus TaxID=59490 RepID=A0AAW1YBD0_RUBAR
MAGLGRTKIALPSQFASAFSFDKIRHLLILLRHRKRRRFLRRRPVLSPSPESTYLSPSHTLLSSSTPSAPPRLSPRATPRQNTSSALRRQSQWQSRGSQRHVALHQQILGRGRDQISTVNPYTVLEASIFKAVTEAFVTESAARNISRVAAVGNFEVCFSTENVFSTRLGPSVPEIDLVLQNESTYWRIFGANSMVYVSDDVLCLGFVNGGENARTSIVIGGHQLEDNLVQFDLATSRVGFSSTLLGRQTTCSNFNFTSVA